MTQRSPHDPDIRSNCGKISKSSSVNPQTPLTFINFPDPSALRDPAKVKLARTHAIGVALARQRLKAQLRGEHFREETTITMQRGLRLERRRKAEPLVQSPGPSNPLTSSSVDPFESLSVNARRLTALLHMKSSLHAGEPVFNINNVIHYQGLQTVFNTGLNDGALTAALSLTLASAANDYKLNSECLQYKSIAMQQLRARLSDPASAASIVTLGTILLLLGIEYRLRERTHVQLHLNGIQEILKLCHQRNVELHLPIRRALFWQDIFASLFVHTARTISYDIFPPDFRITHLSGPTPSTLLPPGFLACSDILGEDFLQITADIQFLYQNRSEMLRSYGDGEAMNRVDSAQAWIETRLCDSLNGNSNPVLASCIWGALLCAYGFWDATWNSALLPRELSANLLEQLGLCEDWEGWRDRGELLLWLVSIGEAFALELATRNGFAGLREGQNGGVLGPGLTNWEETELRLREFIWSDIFYEPGRGSFWQRIGTYSP